MTADQPTTKPQLAGLSAATSTPASRKASTQPPSEPSRGQDAPPSANTAAAASTERSPSDETKRNLPACPNPTKRERGLSVTPRSSSRLSQARKRGVALKLLGNTRPLLPTKVSSPSSAAQPRRASGGKASTAGRKRAVASWYRLRNVAIGSE